MGPTSVPREAKACAKINLTLEVTGRRADGYHEVTSVMQAIDLCDTLRFQPRQGVYLESNVAELVSPLNLVARAIGLLQEVAGSERGVSVLLDKAIPLAAGLGGGSSDAAATLRALNQMWGLGLGSEDLAKAAASLGSDVSFFLGDGATAMVQGRGEKVTPLPCLAETWAVLLRPPVDIPNKTREMYSRVGPSHFTAGEHTKRLVDLIKRGERLNCDLCYNIFDDIAFCCFPQLEEFRLRFLAAGVGRVRLAGSGPTLFSLVEDKGHGQEVCRRLKAEKLEVYLVRTI